VTYHPQQRRVSVQVLTAAGWIAGAVHIPVRSRLVDHFNHAKEYISLTQVIFENAPEPIPFFGLQRDAAMIILPVNDPDEVAAPLGTEEVMQVTVHCLFDRGNATGSMTLLRGVRLSDFFAAQKGFVLLEDARFILADRWGQNVVQDTRPALVLNTRFVIGISDMKTSTTADILPGRITARPKPR
jgi:hypothetical protein